MRQLRIVQLGIDHPHGALYRETLAHHPGFALVGGYDEDPGRATALIAREGLDLPVHGDIEAAIDASRPEAVLVTLPNDASPAAIVAAASYRLPILCEKPCARTAADFAPALATVKQSGIPILPAYLRRFSPVAIAMRDLVAGGGIGEVIAAQVTHLTVNAAVRNAAYLAGGVIEHLRDSGIPEVETSTGGSHWLFDRARSGGGIMHWLGVHWLDLLLMVTGDEVERVSAMLATSPLVPIDVEDIASVTLELAGGAVATIACAYALPEGPDQAAIAIEGTRGWMRWDGSSPKLLVGEAERGIRTLRFDAEARPGYAGALGWSCFNRFHEAISSGRSLPVGSDDAMRVLDLLDAIRRAASAGHTLELANI